MLYVLFFLIVITQVSEMKDSTGKYNYVKTTVNVKTVLFKEADCLRDCWTLSDTSLLITRYHLQMLIQSQIPDDVQILSEYISLCLSTVLKESKQFDKFNRLILTEATCDVLGGYISSFGLPFVYKMFYAGLAKMTAVKTLIGLNDNFKSKLDTNGRGWAPPIQTRDFLNNIRPAKIVCDAYFDFCDRLIFDGSKNESDIDSCEVYSNISLPVIDNGRKPSAIALPLKGLKPHSALYTRFSHTDTWNHLSSIRYIYQVILPVEEPTPLYYYGDDEKS